MMNDTLPEGFVLNKIGMKKFNMYNVETWVDFTNSRFNAIVGITGSGKTSIIDALTFALYGDSSRTDIGFKMEEIIEPNGFVEVQFYKNGNDISVRRGRNSAGKSIINLIVNGVSFKGGIADTNDEIKKIMGVDYKGFTLSSIIRQDEMKTFSLMRTSELVSAFQRIFQLDIFKKALADIKLMKKTVMNEIARNESEIDGFLSAMKNEDDVKAEIDNLKNKRNGLKMKKESMETRMNELKEKIKKFEEKFKEYTLLESKSDLINTKITNIKKNIKDYETNVNDNKKELESLKNKIPEEKEKDLIEIKKRIEDKKELVNKNSIIMNAIKERENFIDEQKKKYNDLMEKYDGGISIDEYTKDAKDVGVIEFKVESGDLNKNILTAKNKFLEQRKDECVKGVVSTVLSKEIGIDDNEDTTFKDELEQNNQTISDLKKEIGSQTTNSIDEKLATIHRINERIKMVKELKSQLSGKKDEIENNKKEIISLEEDLKNIEGKKEELSSNTEQYNETKRDLDKINNDLSAITEKVGETIGKIKSNVSELTRIKKLKESIKEKESALTDLRRKERIYDLIEKEVWHESALPLHATDKIADVISYRASELLNEMTDGKMSILQFQKFKEGNKYGFNIIVDGFIGKKFSGGEKTQINASIRVAISEILSEEYMSSIGASTRTLIIDEGDMGSLSQRERRLFVKTVFTSRKNNFDRGIFITHMPEVVRGLGTTIEIEKTPSGFSRVTSITT